MRRSMSIFNDINPLNRSRGFFARKGQGLLVFKAPQWARVQGDFFRLELGKFYSDFFGLAVVMPMRFSGGLYREPRPRLMPFCPVERDAHLRFTK